jgi:hypothetical protein
MREFAALVRHYIHRRAAHRIADTVVSVVVFVVIVCCVCGCLAGLVGYAGISAGNTP